MKTKKKKSSQRQSHVDPEDDQQYQQKEKADRKKAQMAKTSQNFQSLPSQQELVQHGNQLANKLEVEKSDADQNNNLTKRVRTIHQKDSMMVPAQHQSSKMKKSSKRQQFTPEKRKCADERIESEEQEEEEAKSAQARSVRRLRESRRPSTNHEGPAFDTQETNNDCNAGSDEGNSEYNLAGSCNSSPEHQIATVVAGGSSAASAKASAQHISTASPGNANGLADPIIDRQRILDSPHCDFQVEDPDEAVQTPETQNQNVNGTYSNSQAIGSEAERRCQDRSPGYDIASYTNGNMNELMEEEVKREKAEFMYQFEGAMSVIQETEEPEDEMTMKHSCRSSSLQMLRLDSLATPNERMSKEPVPNRPQEYSIVSPRGVMKRQMQGAHGGALCLGRPLLQQSSGHFSSGRKVHQQSSLGEQVIKESSVSLLEDSQNRTQSFEDNSKPAISISSAPAPKSMTKVDHDNATTFSKLSDLTKNTAMRVRSSPKQKQQQKPARHYLQSPKKGSASTSPSKKSKPAKRHQVDSNASSQLRGFLQRQQEALRNNYVAHGGGDGSQTASQHTGQDFTSPVRLPNPHDKAPTTADQKAQQVDNQKAAQPTDDAQKPARPQEQSQKAGPAPVTLLQKNKAKGTPVLIKDMQLKTPAVKREIFRASPKTEPDNQVLSPVLPQQKSAERERFQAHLQGLNKSIVNLKEDVKERSVLVFKELKVCRVRLSAQASSSLEDKLDCDFLEHVMQVYAFFTSCLNLVLQNDQEAHKLLILQPMIEKHITDLKLDLLVIQQAAADLIDPSDQTLSSIGFPSFNSSCASMNNTLLTNILGGKTSASVTPKRSPQGDPTAGGAAALCSSAKSGSLQPPHKRQHLETLLQLAGQVLALNQLKHKLIKEQRQHRSVSREHAGHQAAARVTAQPTHSGSGADGGAMTRQLDPLKDSPERGLKGQQSEEVEQKIEPPSVIQPEPQAVPFRAPRDTKGQAPKALVAPRVTQITMKKSQSQKAEEVHMVSFQRSSQPEEAMSTKDSSKAVNNKTSTPRSLLDHLQHYSQLPGQQQLHRRHRSDEGSLSSNTPRTVGTNVPPGSFQSQASDQNLVPCQLWSDPASDKATDQQRLATNTYFNTLSTMVGSPKAQASCPASAPKRTRPDPSSMQLASSGSNGNLERVQLVENATLGSICKAHDSCGNGSTERPTQDQTVSAGAQNQISAAGLGKHQGPNSQCHSSSFGVMSSNSTVGNQLVQANQQSQHQVLSIYSNSFSSQVLSPKTVKQLPSEQLTDATSSNLQGHKKDNGDQALFSVLQYTRHNDNRTKTEYKSNTSSLHQNQNEWRAEESFQNFLSSEPQAVHILDQTAIQTISPTERQQSNRRSLLEQYNSAARPSLSPRKQLALKPKETKKTKNCTLSRNMSTGMVQTTKLAGTNKVFKNGTEIISDALSASVTVQKNFIDQSERSVHTSRVHLAAKSKKKKSLPIKKKNASVTQRIVVFTDNDSDNFLTSVNATRNGQETSDVFSKPKIQTRELIHSKTRSYLNSMNASQVLQHNVNEPNGGTSVNTANTSTTRGLSHAHSCQILPDSRMKKALKGVINAQEAFATQPSASKNQKTSNRSSINSSANVTASFNVKSPIRTNQPVTKKNASSLQRYNNQASGGSAITDRRKPSSTYRSPQIAEKQNQFLTAVANHQQQLYATMRPNSRMPTEPTSPQNLSTVSTTINGKKRLPVQSSHRTSSFLLKQTMVIDTEKLMGYSQAAAAHQLRAQGLQSTGGIKTSKTVKSPSQKSLSQAFSAVTKAISKRQQSSSSQQRGGAPTTTTNTTISSKKQSII